MLAHQEASRGCCYAPPPALCVGQRLGSRPSLLWWGEYRQDQRAHSCRELGQQLLIHVSLLAQGVWPVCKSEQNLAQAFPGLHIPLVCAHATAQGRRLHGQQLHVFGLDAACSHDGNTPTCTVLAAVLRLAWPQPWLPASPKSPAEATGIYPCGGSAGTWRAVLALQEHAVVRMPAGSCGCNAKHGSLPG